MAERTEAERTDAETADAPQNVNARLIAKTIPVTVLTGFLGAGKTTLLNKLLGHPDMGEAAVLINEFGEIGIDHLLVKETREDTVLLNSGCLCCTVRGDLVNAMRELFWQRFDKKIPWFKRVVIETTGLADPAPIIHTLMTDPTVGPRYRLDGIVTVVDAVNGAQTLDAQPESVKQAAVADRIVLTKADLASPKQLAAIRDRLRDLNPSAPVFDASAEFGPKDLFDAGLFKADRKIADVAGWPIPWDSFVTWIEMLITTQGENLLRIKGILNVAGEPNPVAVHGVQHLFHPPAGLPGWPDDDHRSKIVFITRDIGRKVIEDTFKAFVDAARAMP